MKSSILLLAAALSTTFCHALEEKLHGVVKEVIDGNTITMVTMDKEEYKIVLHGIDSPEPGQDFAIQSKTFLQDLLLHKQITAIIHGKDRLGNRLGEIRVEGAPDPRHELVRAGLAWTSEKALNPELEILREEARLNSLGIWKDENPTPPWVFRRQQSMMDSKSS